MSGDSSVSGPRPVVVEVDRELTARTVESLRARLWVHATVPVVVLDLSKVEIVTTPAIGLLLEFRRAVQSHQGRVILARPSPLVHDVVRRTKLDQLFPTTPDLESATQLAAR